MDARLEFYIKTYMDVVKKFTNAGFEIQMTEMDIANITSVT